MAIIREPNRRGHRKASTSEGAVLGIDVGWSKKKPTTGLCLIEWEDREIRLCFCKARCDRGDRRRKLNQLVNGKRLLAVAIDGPLMENLNLRKSPQYRAVDALLSRGKFQHRGKAGPTNGGSGPKLYEEATELANLVIENQKVKKATYPYKIHEKAVVEAFPNAFLAVLHPDKGFPSKPKTARRWTDTLFPRVKQKLDQLMVDLLPQYKRGFIYEDLQGHEDIASFLCALTALCVADGQCVAVGDHRLGYIVLPPLQFWGESSAGTSKWAEDALRDNRTGVLRKFKDLMLYKDNKLWIP